MWTPGPIELFVIALALLWPGLLGVWIWMLVDCAVKEEEGTDKIVWMLVILFANFVGAFIYLFAKKLPRDRAVS
jgi:hypothetical protein